MVGGSCYFAADVDVDVKVQASGRGIVAQTRDNRHETRDSQVQLRFPYEELVLVPTGSNLIR